MTRRVWELVEPVALASGLELIDVQYRPENGRVMLRLLIDRPAGGVTLDELARLSRALGDVLDAHDAIPGRYHLECSSPGINRPLLKESHFRRALGEHERIRVRTREPIDGRRQFHGTIADVAADAVTLTDPDVGTVRIAFTAIEKASVDHDFSRPSRPHAHA